MRTVLVLLMLVGTAHAERPTSATAVVDNLISDLVAKRYEIAAKALAPKVSLRNVTFRGACKKQFPADTAGRGAALAKCLASDIVWPDARLIGTEIRTPMGWRVEYDGLKVNVKRTRDRKGYEVVSIVLPGPA